MKSIRHLNAAVVVCLFLSAVPAFANNCAIADTRHLTCDFEGVPDDDAVTELLPLIADSDSSNMRQQAARLLIDLLNERNIVTDQPDAAFTAFAVLGNTIREDTYWDQALNIVSLGGVTAPAESREFVEFISRRAHQLRMAGDFDTAHAIVVATFGDGPLPDAGRNLNVFATIEQMHFADHVRSTRLLASWSGASPIESELLIVEALDGDPEALFLIGRVLVEGGDRSDLNLRRVQMHTGHLEGGPYDAARGAEFLEAALAAGIAEAASILERYREDQRLEEEARERAELAEAAAQAERERLAEIERAERIAEAAAQVQTEANRESAIDIYLREQNTHVNRMGGFWNSCVAETQNPEWGGRYCDCIVVRSVELLGQERANVALAVGVGINDQFLGQVVAFCVDLTRR